MSRLRNFAMVIDQLFNVVLLNGKPKETMSINAAERQVQGAKWACVLCRFLDFAVEKDHCAKSLTTEPTSNIAIIKATVLFALLIFAICMMVQFGILGIAALFA